ncbi:S10 family peptidase [Salinarimonas soli]|uniref:Peptidase S10 n=1 Tax=Salinarimonas soli TaxID=1638099 RepID=A0A5B2VAH9_9HYPH|nr:peptidase S10 [Salinarimonas soli]KAA2236533.1 peptidase S10 [Salinarimonas soli]
MRPVPRRPWLLLVLALGLAMPALAQQPAPAPGGDAPAAERRQGRPAEAGALPAESVTRHRLQLPGRELAFTAVAGSLPLLDRAGKVEADIGFVAYLREGEDPARRPVTFAVNGGPGAASAYLHLGVLGPWRLPLDGPTVPPSSSPALVPNGETWLDFTDLVFIDPVGTGYSLTRPGTPDDLRNRLLSVEGDIDALATIVSRWLKDNGRLASPKFFVGESYGGFRGPLLAEKLQTDQGVGFSGLVLLSPVLDFGWRSQPSWNPLPQVSLLPSAAAAAMEQRGPVDRKALRAVEAYASGEFVTDLLRGQTDPAALDRLGARVAELTGLDPALARRLGGRLDMRTLQRELRRGEGLVTSAYDTGVTAFDPDPTSPQGRFSDPVLEGMTAPLTSAIVDHLSRTLKWDVPDRRYQLLNGGVSRAWRWGGGRSQPESLNELRSALALDRRMRALVVHGFTDLVTPYFESELLLRQVPDYGAEGRVRLEVYPGGHMFYSRDGSRRAFRADAETLYREAIRDRPVPANAP